MRIVTTPFAELTALPSPREGGLAAPLLEALVAPPDALRARLASPGVLAVTTGQQPGLFTGPLYTVHKALSAAALARLLSARWGRPVVPIFWSAGDDHDFAEGNHASWPAMDGSTVTATLRERPADAPLTPLSRERLGAEVEALLERLGADLPAGEGRDQALALLRRHYQADATLGSAAAGTLAELLAPFGIAVFDPTHRAAKQAQATLLISAVERHADLELALVARDAVLRSRGQEAGVTVGDGATLVMLDGEGGRDRLVARDGDFFTRRGGQRFSLEQLQEISASAPERLSANVLLRPVVESALLPTVAYVAGPGELKYLALAEALYPVLAVPRQLPVPRWSGVLVEPRVDRVLEKFGATLEELLAPGQVIEARVVRSQMPEAALSALGRLREAISAEYEILVKAAAGIDPTIEKPIQQLGNQALAGTQDAEKRLVNHLKKRQATETQQIARAREAVLPGGVPQERVITLAPWQARYGASVLEEIEAACLAWYQAGLERLSPGT